MNIGIIGTGHVASNLAAGLGKAGHKIALGSRNPSRATEERAASIVTRKEAATFGEIVILAVPFGAIKDAVQAIGPNALHGKTVVDATNAIGPQGEWALGHSTSGAEELQKMLPGAKVVKAFNTVFAHTMASGSVGGKPLALFVAGDDAKAKAAVLKLAADIGFEPVDAGPLRSARYTEPIALQMIHLAYGMRMGPNLGLALVRG